MFDYYILEMKVYNDERLLEKVTRVIKSCETFEQWENARKYAKLAIKKSYVKSIFSDAVDDLITMQYRELFYKVNLT